jgi:YgiT-type zinc finger domain-containing protein
MKNSKSNQIHCDNCNTLTETVFRNNLRLTYLGQSFYLDNVESQTCPNCDNFYLSESTLQKSYKIIEHQQELVAA